MAESERDGYEAGVDFLDQSESALEDHVAGIRRATRIVPSHCTLFY